MSDWRVYPVLATLGSGRTVFLGSPDDGDAKTLATLVVDDELVPACDYDGRAVRELRVRGGDVAELVLVGPPPDYDMLWVWCRRSGLPLDADDFAAAMERLETELRS